MIILEAKNIKKSFKIIDSKIISVLNGINLKISFGEQIALKGASGSGKSTLLHILASLDIPDSGDIIFEGKKVIFDLKNENLLSKYRNKDIGIIYQFHHLLPEFTAVENVMMPSLIAGIRPEESKIKASKLLSETGMSHRLEHYPKELSGGEQQRVAIARALINQPKLIFADEPTGSLDKKNSQNILNILSELKNKYNLTLLIATHSEEIASSSERKIILENGILIENNNY